MVLWYNIPVKLTSQVKLIVTPEQADALKRTVQTANAASDEVSRWAWDNQTFGQYKMHYGTYSTIRADFGLTAQVAVRCIAKVCDSYKLDKLSQRTFQPLGAIAYDSRILRWKLAKSEVSIWTVDGRMTLPFVCGPGQRLLLETQQGESDLCFVGGHWMLNATCNVEDPPPSDTTGGYLGIDMGIVELATDSEGKRYSGEQVKSIRRRVRKHRSGLQHQAAEHSKSAYRRLCRMRRKVSRFARHTNHVISKRIVESALESRKAIAIEDLTGIRERASAFNREMRWQMGNWGFDQLRQFLTYKAQRLGIALVTVDPRNTSRTCSVCGYCDKANRHSQSVFHCLKCGHDANADANAAKNISARGEIKHPMDGRLAYAS